MQIAEFRFFEDRWVIILKKNFNQQLFREITDEAVGAELGEIRGYSARLRRINCFIIRHIDKNKTQLPAVADHFNPVKLLFIFGTVF